MTYQLDAALRRELMADALRCRFCDVGPYLPTRAPCDVCPDVPCDACGGSGVHVSRFLTFPVACDECEQTRERMASKARKAVKS